MEVYVFVALRRKKDPCNEGLSARCKRIVSSGNDNEALGIIKRYIDTQKGLWRIYVSINKRDTLKAQDLLISELILNRDKFSHKIDNKWKSVLMIPGSKAEDFWLIDVDTEDKDVLDSVIFFIRDNQVTPGKAFINITKTPNGYHVKTEKFNTRDFKGEWLDNVEIKRDALLFLEVYNGRKSSQKDN